MASVIPGQGITEKMVEDADGSLVNWKFHLPDDKKNILRPDGEIDVRLQFISSVYLASPETRELFRSRHE
jgi:hypothetical protein